MCVFLIFRSSFVDSLDMNSHSRDSVFDALYLMTLQDNIMYLKARRYGKMFYHFLYQEFEHSKIELSYTFPEIYMYTNLYLRGKEGWQNSTPLTFWTSEPCKTQPGKNVNCFAERNWVCDKRESERHCRTASILTISVFQNVGYVVASITLKKNL